MAVSNYPPPTSLYIHVPFCRQRCGYCNFALVADRDYLIDEFLQALQQELSTLPYQGAVETIYLGGGTPTLLDESHLDVLFEIIAQRFWMASDGEFTVEANPDDVTPQKVSLLIHRGVNRISLGAQSFQPEKLRSLDRSHSAEQIKQAVEACGQLTSISLDLIFGVAGESLNSWQNDLQTAVSLPITHLSTYELTIEKGTRFWNRRFHGQQLAVDDDFAGEMYESTIDFLTQPTAGFEHYEVSSFAKSGHRCRHNQSYWNGQRYLACGPGAAGFIDNRRYRNHPSLAVYLRRLKSGQSAMQEEEVLTPQQIAIDLLVFGIRQLDGSDLQEVREQAGGSLGSPLERSLDRHIAAGRLQFCNGKLQLTRHGLMLADSICGELFAASQRHR